ncbi:MAG: hypothetical protein AAI978_00485 [Candidatus Hodgkinia cicadicola]
MASLIHSTTQITIKAYGIVLKARYWHNNNKTSPVALCLITKFNNPNSEALNKILLNRLQKLGFNTIAFWIKPKLVRTKIELTKPQELSLQLMLDWLTERHVNAKSKWLIATSCASALAISTIIRRPEITNYLLIAPIVNHTNLALAKLLIKLKLPGTIILAENDTAAPISTAWQLANLTKALGANTPEFVIIRRTNHFFVSQLNNVSRTITKLYYRASA